MNADTSTHPSNPSKASREHHETSNLSEYRIPRVNIKGDKRENQAYGLPVPQVLKRAMSDKDVRVLIAENAELKRRDRAQKREFAKEKTKMSLKLRMLRGDLYNARTEHRVTKYKLEKSKREKKELRDESDKAKRSRSSKTKPLKDEIKSLKKQLNEYKASTANKPSTPLPTATRGVEVPSRSTGFFFNNPHLSGALQGNVVFRSAYAGTHSAEP